MTPEEEIKSAIVAYLGPPASYTHQAALETFPQSQGFVLSPRGTISDIFTSVQDQTAKYGVVPFENSTYGSVVPTLDLFADRDSVNMDAVVCGEAYLDIHHYLLGHLPPSLPVIQRSGNSVSVRELGSTSGHTTPTPKTPNPSLPKSHPLVPIPHIKRVYSHYQAFGQCDLFLSSYLKNAERQETSSTSKAAQIAKADSSGESAAISSYAAAEVHGLSVLAVGIEDKGDNATRFLVLRRKDVEEEDGKGEGEEGEWKSMVGFTIDHQVPGKLADALTVFKECGLNLTSINSRPSRDRPWHYFFFVEFGGKRAAGNNVDETLSQLDRITEGCRFYGSWRDRSPKKLRG